MKNLTKVAVMVAAIDLKEELIMKY